MLTTGVLCEDPLWTRLRPRLLLADRNGSRSREENINCGAGAAILLSTFAAGDDIAAREAARALPEPESPRRLGRSRVYTPGDLPGRLKRWHSPRVNRWERLRVTAGRLAIERREAAGAARRELPAGESLWIAPGTRWRVADMPAGTRFEFEVHADSRGEAGAPQTLRSELLDDAQRSVAADAGELSLRLEALAPGERRLIEARFAPDDAAMRGLPGERIFWHPLARSGEAFTVLAARAGKPFGLAEYLGRDHAVIEAALAGMLRGNEEHAWWLGATLERHLHIEEELVFPAYLEAGGREAWVRGLKKEHGYLRRYLGGLDDPGNRRKFLRLLDGHDEKEERVVYPDIADRLGERAATLLPRAKTFPISP